MRSAGNALVVSEKGDASTAGDWRNGSLAAVLDYVRMLRELSTRERGTAIGRMRAGLPRRHLAGRLR